LVLPFRLVFDQVSVLYTPGNISPILSFTKKVQWIGTIGPFEDLFYKSFSAKDRLKLHLNKIFMKYSAMTSSHVIFMSEYTFKLFVNMHNFNEKKGSVIRIGRDINFYPSNKITQEKALKYAHKKFILSVSILYPYKNIETLIKAFSQCIENNNELVLLIAGSSPFIKYYDHLLDLVESLGLTNKVIFLGHLNKAELRDFYSSCYMFVFTSPFENFSHILIEAMSCGAPVVTTNTTAMPEACGDVALYFDPYDVDQLSCNINKILLDKSLRELCVKNSIIQSQTINLPRGVSGRVSEILSKQISF
jgi:glycosyltransferase involved in cell wall biosynthesis